MSETKTVEFLAVSAGMAGASAAYVVAADERVPAIERENEPGDHTTGRSAVLSSVRRREPVQDRGVRP